MKKNTISTITILVLVALFATTQVFANPINIDNLQKYDFDVSDDVRNSTISKPLSILTFLVYFIFFILIAALAYFTTRWLGKHQMKIRVKSKYMEVIDSLQLSADNALYIVKSPEGLLLLGTGKEGVSLLQKLESEEAEFIMQAEENLMEDSFSAQLSNYLSKIKGFAEHNKLGGEK